MRLMSVPENIAEAAALVAGAVPTPLMDTLVGLLLAKTIMAATAVGVFDAGILRPQVGQPASYGPAMSQTGQPDADGELAPVLQRQIVPYPSKEPAGTIIIDTPHTVLYLTLGSGKAIRYGIGVGRKGFTWSGVERVSRKSEWPDWIPPAEMIARQPYLPRWVGGGPGNPLGARALYLGNTDYRIHGTNNPASIGTQVSSGCIRLRNDDVIDLYHRVSIGTKVIVLPGDPRTVAGHAPDGPRAGVVGERGAAALQTARYAAVYVGGARNDSLHSRALY